MHIAGGHGVFRVWVSRALAATLALIVFCSVSFPQSKEAFSGRLGRDAFSPQPNAETRVSVQSGGDLSEVALYNEAVGLYGKGEYEKAASTYMRACNIYAKACTNLGFMFNNGQGVKKSHLLAAELYERGCDNGSALGCTNLGIMYWKDELSGDYKRAAEFFDRGCRGGDSGGCRGLGFLYEYGYGVTADKTRAAELYRLADQLSRVHQIPFRLQDGMVLISPILNGKSVLLIVDTGSSRTTLDRRVLPPSLSVNQPTAVLSTPIGDQKAYSVDFSWNLDGRDIRLSSLVGDFDFPYGAVGLFGADILETFSSVRFDYAAMVLTLEER
jgi:TPR repeat protein